MLNLDLCLSDIPLEARRKAKNDKVYVNLTVDKMKQADAYGFTHTIYVQQTKEERQSKAPKAYIGKAKEVIFEKSTPPVPESTDDLGF